MRLTLRAALGSLCILAFSCARPSHSLRKGPAIDLCDLSSDRTIVGVVDATIVRIGTDETLELDYGVQNGNQVKTRIRATAVSLDVHRVLSGESTKDVYLGDLVLPDGESHYGNLKTHPSGIYFLRATGGALVVPTEGYFKKTKDNLYSNTLKYRDGINISEIEQALKDFPKGVDCPNDEHTVRFDSQFEIPDSNTKP